MRLSGAAIVLFSLAAHAQTFIVDVNNGPGTSFTSIAAAAAAVPDGSTLIVRVGHYDSFAVTGKSLTVLGDTGGPLGSFVSFGEFLTGSISISGLAANQRVVMRGLRSSLGHLVAVATVTCQNCQGSILLDAISQGSAGSLCLEVDQCLQVQVTHCGFTGGSGPYGARIVASDVMLVDSQFRSGTTSQGLQQVGGRVQIAGCELSGAFGFPGPGSPGVLMQGGDLRLLAGSTVMGGQGFSGYGLAIDGSGTVRVDPAVVMSGQPPLVAPGVAVTTMLMPDVRASGGGLGLPATGTMNGPSNTFGVLLLGLPDAPLSVPGWDPFWISGSVVMAAGMLGSPLAASVAVPSNPALTGACFGWQALSFDAAFAIQVSNAAWFVLRP